MLRRARNLILILGLVLTCASGGADDARVMISGVIPDPDKVSNCLAGLPPKPTIAQRGMCLSAGLVGNQAVKLDRSNIETTSDASGAFVMLVPSNTSIRFVLLGDETYEPTLGNE